MESTLKILMNNPYAWAVISIITIAGFVITVRGLKRKYKQITYTKKTYPYIVPNPKEYPDSRGFIEINGQKMKDISLTKIAIWNSGNEEINSTDIAVIEPLRVFLKKNEDDSTQIISCFVELQTDETILKEKGPLKVKEDNICPIPIDYMAPNNGLIIGVIHNTKVKNIVLDCRIKGGEEVLKVRNNGIVYMEKNENPTIIQRISDLISEILDLLAVLISTISICFFLSMFYILIALFMHWPKSFIYILTVLTFFFLISPISKFHHWFISQKIRVPKELKKQLEKQPAFMKLDENGNRVG